MSLGKPVVVFQNMDEDMQKFAVEQAQDSLATMFHEQVSNRWRRETWPFVQEIATYLKKSFETKFRSNWHCVVGKSNCSLSLS